MTFSILSRDASGAIGAAIASSSPAVAARCITLADGVGGANSQNITDPRLGPKIVRLIDAGLPAAQAVAQVAGADPTAEFRQLIAIDRVGGTGVYSGGRSLGIHGSAEGLSVVAAGNLLATDAIPQTMVDAFTRADGDLETRLIAALRAAVAAGGEAGPIHSAGLSVVRDAGWRVTDLRVDWHEHPVSELADLLDIWLPQRDDYVTRGLNPSAAPGYGVAGDE
ncbi:DUF1028 domain-containing protein [Diaminobutyricibacter sp. McL0618]|uniref:DUF1028 domain-containing protein n=1 Tax=Leifsonia sp. McL0618 TaxID=3415677 RepID=UPI003CED2E5F